MVTIHPRERLPPYPDQRNIPKLKIGADSNLSAQRDCGLRYGHAGQVTAHVSEVESGRPIQSADSGGVESLDIPACSTQRPACGAEGADRDSATAVRVEIPADHTTRDRVHNLEALLGFPAAGTGQSPWQRHSAHSSKERCQIRGGPHDRLQDGRRLLDDLAEMLLTFIVIVAGPAHLRQSQWSSRTLCISPRSAGQENDIGFAIFLSHLFHEATVAADSRARTVGPSGQSGYL